jgi:phosphopantothenoylcysteine decarboxylase/phosphopantothenate--cysteine ligase
VRYLTNRSSGKMGFRLAESARDRGAAVTIIAGPSAESTPYGVRRIDVITGLEMLDAVLRELPLMDVLVMAAAVADYRPAQVSAQKIKKAAGDSMTLELVRNPDILKEVAAVRAKDSALENLIVVGFAAETQNLVENGQKKLIEKNLDLVVANAVPESFAGDESQATFIYRDQPLKPFALQPKSEVADAVWSVVVERLFKKT